MKMSHQNEELKGRRSLCNEHISAHGKTTANTAHVEIKRNLTRMTHPSSCTVNGCMCLFYKDEAKETDIETEEGNEDNSGVEEESNCGMEKIDSKEDERPRLMTTVIRSQVSQGNRRGP
jgi:hypothetical protein